MTDSRKIHKSLDISWKEGIPASVMLGIVDYYIVPLGLFLGASTQQIGFLVAIPQLMASIAQLFAVRAVRSAGNRLRFLVISAALQAVLLIPISLLPLLSLPYQIAILIALMISFRVLGNLIATAWGSLVSDYLPAHKRGHYFGWRSQVVGIAALASIGAAGVILFFMKQVLPALGFFTIFFAASACRFTSVWLLSKMTDLPLHHSPESDFSFWDFVRRWRESNFVKFVLFNAVMTFTTFLSAPYASVFILRDLHFDYLSYMGIQVASVTSSLIAYPIWGKHADLVGNVKILKITGSLIPVIPVLWLAAPLFHYNPIYFMMIEPFAGFVWGGFNLCSTNFIYDAVTPQKRVRCLSYFTLFNGISIFLGAALGGYLANHLPALFGFQLMSLFLFSCALRWIGYFTFSGLFKEVRENVSHASVSQIFLSIFGLSPLKGLSHSWGFFPKVDTGEKEIETKPE